MIRTIPPSWRTTATRVCYCWWALSLTWRPSAAFSALRLPRSTTTTTTRLAAATSETDSGKIPIALLAGFLGSGKTTTLQHLLHNTEGYKLGIIVNDVASVNIDGRLIAQDQKGSSQEGSGDGVIELQNGCACCSLADELLDSVQQLLDSKTNQKDPFQAIVVELSGVADPMAIQENWKMAKILGPQASHPATQKARMGPTITLVDASTFGTDWMTWDTAKERKGWTEDGDECAGNLKIPELLAEQIEAASVVVINKEDLAGPEQTLVASELARKLNTKAKMETTSFGKISPQQLLDYLNDKQPTEQSEHEHTHSHDKAACAEPDCTDPSHSHSHSHDHSASDCTDPDCTDASHSHSHSHDHGEDCADPNCTDPSHSHSHSHSHATSTDQLGIVNFVYRASRPFNLRLIMELLNRWPVPVKNTLDLKVLQEAQEEGYEIQGETVQDNPFVGVLRSKGFCWFAPTRWSGQQEDTWRHETAMLWSHAGKHFGLSTAGRWWATVPAEEMKRMFKEDPAEYERIQREEFVSEEFGDRRQEIVFIGVGLDEEKITAALDACLISESVGMGRYRKALKEYEESILALDS